MGWPRTVGVPIDFECKLLIIICLFVVDFPLSTWFFWVMGSGGYWCFVGEGNAELTHF